MIILGIETSCDETAASLLKIENCKLKIISNVVSSQVKIHAKYGGIVPEVAARKHAENIIGVLTAALNSKSETRNPKQILNPNSKILKQIDAIAVTSGPGLITSLLIGVEAAKALAFITKKPLIPVNHLAGHIYANWLQDADKRGFTPLDSFASNGVSADLRGMFPAICLIVSGGHTELVLMSRPKSGSRQGSGRDSFNFRKIGQTLDDAAGECFDKAAKILGLGYPGGPAIATVANQYKSNSRIFANKFVNISDIKLPRPMINSGDFNFSFSGLKTAVLYKVQKMSKQEIKKNLPEICNEVQQAIIDVLIAKTIKVAQKFNVKSIILGGGVVANQELREQFKLKIENLKLKINLLIPSKNLCTDNAAMIAVAGYFKLATVPKKDWQKKFDWRKIKVDPNLEI